MGPQMDLLPVEGESKIELFQRREIRKTMHGNEWWFSVKDIVEAVTGAADGTSYVAGLRRKDEGLDQAYSEITKTLPFKSAGGTQKTTFTNIEGVFRLMQSVPSSKAEPLKKWLAKVGFERLEETQNPELAIKRAIATYRAKGYDDDWIDARIRNKANHSLLCEEWDKRGVIEYVAFLTDAISVGTFGIKTAEHKRIKGLKGQPLRDHMTPIELTLTTLGEQATREITKATNPSTVQQHMNVASQGGRIAGNARVNIERATGKPVVSDTNYLTARQRANNAQLNPKNLNEILEQLLGPTKSH